MRTSDTLGESVLATDESHRDTTLGLAIVVPAYNAALTIRETLDSLLAQSSCCFEVIVVDDGSTDATRQIALEYAARDPRFEVVTKPNGGTGSAYNVGVRHSRTKWIALLSADDVLESGHVESYLAALASNPRVGLASSDGKYLYEDGRTERAYAIPRMPAGVSLSLSDLFQGCYFAVGSVFSRAAWEKVGGFDEDIYGEDYLFFLRVMAAGYKHLFIDEQLAIHRRHSAQKSAATERVILSDLQILRRVESEVPVTYEQRADLHAAIAQREHQLRIAHGDITVKERLHEGAVAFLISTFGRERTEILVNRLKGRRVR